MRKGWSQDKNMLNLEQALQMINKRLGLVVWSYTVFTAQVVIKVYLLFCGIW
jgi:hypothetical protein